MTFYIYVLSQELKESMTNGQLLLDFLCQPGPRVMVMDVQALRYERTMFAENLGALRLKWLLLQRELESQVCSSATKKKAPQLGCSHLDPDACFQKIKSKESFGI